MIAQVNVTKSEGAVGVYDDKFVAMEKKLAEIDAIIKNLNQSEANMTTMDDSLENIRLVDATSNKYKLLQLLLTVSRCYC